MAAAELKQFYHENFTGGVLTAPTKKIDGDLLSNIHKQADALVDDAITLAYDVWANFAGKRFGWLREQGCGALVTLLNHKDQHLYEVIRTTRPARLFLDVEWPAAVFADRDPDAVLEATLTELEDVFVEPPLRDRMKGGKRWSCGA